jgi:hypothetical protein
MTDREKSLEPRIGFSGPRGLQLRVLFLVIVFAVGVSSAAADTTYTYRGNPFDVFDGTAQCPPTCRISGWFTVPAPFAADSSTIFTPESFSFTDGAVVVDKANATSGTFFWVITNSMGEITGWNNSYFNAVQLMFSSTNPPGCTGCYVIDSSGDRAVTTFAANYNDPGAWTMTTTPTPEPSSLLLLGTGVLLCFLRAMSGERRVIS